MFRDRSEELARLEAELLAAEEEPAEPQEDEYDEDFLEEDAFEETEEEDCGYPPVTEGYQIYNTDVTDEDLESYAEAVRTPKRAGCTTFLVVLLCLLTVGLLGLIAMVLRQRGLL